MNELDKKKTYLNQNFKIFHIRDKLNLQFEYHHHDFNKIIIFIEGDVTYMIEGKSYRLKPWDVVFINANDIHKPIINHNQYYERIVIWIKPEFIFRHNHNSDNLFTCFDITNKNKCNILRVNLLELKEMKFLINRIKDNEVNNDFGKSILSNAMFLEFMVMINRIFLTREKNKDIENLKYDERIDAILEYINSNLNRSISIDEISSKFFISKHHLMRKFKSTIGESIHNYIIKKRLILAKTYMKQGLKMKDISEKCGFNEYSTFARAFKRTYGVYPKQYISNSRHILEHEILDI